MIAKFKLKIHFDVSIGKGHIIVMVGANVKIWGRMGQAEMKTNKLKEINN